MEKGMENYDSHTDKFRIKLNRLWERINKIVDTMSHAYYDTIVNVDRDLKSCYSEYSELSMEYLAFLSRTNTTASERDTLQFKS